MKFIDRIVGQRRVREYLEAARQEGQISHAYLLVGPPGSGQMEAAEALSMLAICPHGGCGECEECRRVLRGTHPDVHILEPEGQYYLVEQIRQLIADASLRPIRASKLIYIITHADLLQRASANALLKTLEEPPATAIFILLARNTDAMLPTIVSRCNVIPFRVLSTKDAVSAIEQLGAYSAEEATYALSITHNPQDALDWLGNAERRHVRDLSLRAVLRLGQADSWDILKLARELVLAAGAPLSEIKEEQERELEESKEFLNSRLQKRLEQRNRRQLTAREKQGLREVIAAVVSLLRDALLVLEAGQLAAPAACASAISDKCASIESSACGLSNLDIAPSVYHFAEELRPEGILRALDICRSAEADIATNISPQLIIEVMLCSAKEALYVHRYSGEV